MSVTLSGGGHAATDHQPPIAAARTEIHGSPWVRLDLSPADRREVVRAFVVALRGFAATGHLVKIRAGNMLDSAEALTEVADSDAVVEALTFLISPADADALGFDLDELSTTGASDPGSICEHCYGLNGHHRMLHVRHGNGGGHNKPCPAADSDQGVA